MKTILIVDDSITVRMQMRRFLESNGYSVVEANDGVDGLETASSTDVDMMIVDVNMPRMNGIDMTREVRALSAHTRTPIFMLTTEGGKDMINNGRAAGVTAWMVKPFKPDLLLRGIQRVLAN